jgi:hypothetical protein
VYNTLTTGTELVTADSNSAPQTLSSCLKIIGCAAVSDPAVTNSKTDEKKRETVFAIADSVPVIYRNHGIRVRSGIGFSVNKSATN